MEPLPPGVLPLLNSSPLALDQEAEVRGVRFVLRLHFRDDPRREPLADLAAGEEMRHDIERFCSRTLTRQEGSKHLSGDVILVHSVASSSTCRMVASLAQKRRHSDRGVP